MRLQKDIYRQSSTPAHHNVRKKRIWNYCQDFVLRTELIGERMNQELLSSNNNLILRMSGVMSPLVFTSGLRTPDSVRIQRPLLAPTEEDIWRHRNSDASCKKPSNTIKPTTSDGSALCLDYTNHTLRHAQP